MILIVDDEPAVRTAMEKWFKLRGFETDTAVDGVEAVDKCLANAYEVVTMDLEMPHMNGIDAIRAINQHRPDIPVIVLSGFSRHVEQLRDLTIATLVLKPIRMPDLEKVVRQVISSAGS